MEVPNAEKKHDECCQRETDEDRIEPRRVAPSVVE